MEWGNIDKLLLKTKLTVPPIYSDRIMPRQRLYWHLDTGVQHPILLITAPAGFGKTTLVAEWLRQKELAAAWVSLEKADNDLLRFWRYVIIALCRQHDSICQQMETWLIEAELISPSSLTVSALNIETILSSLINALQELTQNVLLVLDDYQEITNFTIHQSMSFLLEHLPSHFHLLIVTRVDPPLELARLRMQGKLMEIRAADLRLTINEARNFLHQLLTAMGQEVSSPWSLPQEHQLLLIETLSEREYSVLRLIGEGLSNQEIARTLVVSVSTIKTHLNNIYAKLHVHTRLQAVTKAYNLGLLSRGKIETEPLKQPGYSEKKSML